MPARSCISSNAQCADQEAFLSSTAAVLATFFSPCMADFSVFTASFFSALASVLAAEAGAAGVAGVAWANTAAENTVAIRAASSLFMASILYEKYSGDLSSQ